MTRKKLTGKRVDQLLEMRGKIDELLISAVRSDDKTFYLDDVKALLEQTQKMILFAHDSFNGVDSYRNGDAVQEFIVSMIKKWSDGVEMHRGKPVGQYLLKLAREGDDAGRVFVQGEARAMIDRLTRLVIRSMTEGATADWKEKVVKDLGLVVRTQPGEYVTFITKEKVF